MTKKKVKRLVSVTSKDIFIEIFIENKEHLHYLDISGELDAVQFELGGYDL